MMGSQIVPRALKLVCDHSLGDSGPTDLLLPQEPPQCRGYSFGQRILPLTMLLNSGLSCLRNRACPSELTIIGERCLGNRFWNALRTSFTGRGSCVRMKRSTSLSLLSRPSAQLPKRMIFSAFSLSLSTKG